jgi:hypothetical protein
LLVSASSIKNFQIFLMFFAVKSMAQRQGRSAGEVLSELARSALQAPVATAAASSAQSALDAQLAALGLTPYRAPDIDVVSQAQVDALREAEGV